MSDVDEVGSGDKPMLCIPGAPYPAGESKPNIAAWNLRGICNLRLEPTNLPLQFTSPSASNP